MDNKEREKIVEEFTKYIREDANIYWQLSGSQLQLITNLITKFFYEEVIVQKRIYEQKKINDILCYIEDEKNVIIGKGFKLTIDKITNFMVSIQDGKYVLTEI